ncbi:hypothetical protein BU14_0319s0002 [Porphyra umbilicalis]|uniref:BTB domain-containing protein n=1 Tax=Porphyra umbilicalis TaxID=2786 RepID=A0A1X6NZ86_PORUM|nr:hypothetical protein BU14_0319s0002 [Porphyra umbilicalis]|eukprot:OSX73914.1 hypothetical protein BU14_0319s0002 [Porphyra umbilicalis]
MRGDVALRGLCDLTLHVGPRSFAVHRAVLAAASPVFRAMFVGPMVEAGAAAVRLHGVHPASMAVALEFIYTAAAALGGVADALRALGAARMYHLGTLEAWVEAYLVGRLGPANAGRLWGWQRSTPWGACVLPQRRTCGPTLGR